MLKTARAAGLFFGEDLVGLHAGADKGRALGEFLQRVRADVSAGGP